jgi:uncharacterized membrane protein YraQ (UPF0718 family)
MSEMPIYGRTKAVPVLRSVVVQGIGLGGLVAFIEGIRQIYEPAALVVGGALVVAWAILKMRE